MTHRRWMALAAAGGLAAMALAGCGGSDDDAPLTAAAACDALVGLRVDAGTIGLPTRGALVKGATLVAATPSLREHCLATGSITSVNPNAQDINFAVGLPSDWNGKAMHFGGGGLNGSVPNVTTILAISGPSPLARGYATFSGDSGHQAPADPNLQAAFALNDEMLRNYASDALKKTRDVAIRLVTQRYGAAPSRTYFVGGSKGGQEGMHAMQRWGSEYDGIITLFPAWGYMPQVMSWQVYARSLRGNGGVGFLNPAKQATLRAGELAACDALDGATDGLVSNLAACTFSPTALRCPGGADTGDSCLSDAQVQTVKAMQTRITFPYAFRNDVRDYAPFPIGTDYASSLGTSPVFPAPAASLGSMHYLTDSIVRGFVLRDLTANSLTFDPLNPGNNAARIQELSNILDASSLDIQPFKARGKWIVVHGLSDQLISFGGSVDYYNRLVAKYGQAEVTRFMRFYVVPGYGHGTGAFQASNGMPTLEALEQWVERDVTPGPLTVTDTTTGAPRTRPLCEYPKWPRYTGSGDINAASSFTCASN